MQNTDAVVFLVGPMGSGKTTIGRLVARDLGLAFHDCDQELERRTGASVNLIFDVEGESGFRRREAALLRNLARRRGVLISTGGGVVTRESNRKLLRSSGLVVWLRTSVDQQLRRLSHDKTRPLLQTADRKARLESLARQRDPLYAAVCDLEFTSPNRNARYAAARLAELIRAHWQQAPCEDNRRAGP
ncbi:MAG: shikimate kinase [Xanthomonadales bacterium]|nr:shikimate kinase [Xanthomonadales bacterium]